VRQLVGRFIARRVIRNAERGASAKHMAQLAPERTQIGFHKESSSLRGDLSSIAELDSGHDYVSATE